MTKFGLTERNLKTLRNVLRKYSEVGSIYIFGSRAMQTHHSGSDIDIALSSKKLSKQLFRQLKADLEESDLPFFVDVVWLEKLPPGSPLREHINRVGKVFALDE